MKASISLFLILLMIFPSCKEVETPTNSDQKEGLASWLPGIWTLTEVTQMNGSISINGFQTSTFTGVGENVVTVTPDPNICSSVPFDPYSSTWVKSWEEFWQVKFPGPINDSKHLTIAIEGFHAFEFNTANIVDDGKLTTIETTFTDGLRLGSISKCPGDFDVPAECQHTWGISGGIRWATNNRSGACQLEPETTYYFNLTFTDGVTAGSTTCNKIPCITNVQYRNRQ